VSKGKFLAVCFVWLLLLGIGVVVWKAIFVPARRLAEQESQEALEQQRERERKEKLESAGSPSRYRHQIDFYLDSFSGYAIIRSAALAEELGGRGIRLHLHDDGADYAARLRALRDGDAQLAVFTIDALIKASADLGELPATIVGLVDETTGADAIVAYKSAVPNIDALNRAETRFVLTRNSPSETLARVVMARFELNQLSPQPFIDAKDARDVFERYRAARPNEPLAYVLWEPFVSQILKNPQTHVVVDSSHFPSAIVDVIVASRDFVVKNHDLVKGFVECYLRAVYRYRAREEFRKLVIEDAEKSGSPLTVEEADKLVDGIWWKNTQENLAHMGLLPGKPLPHIEDMIVNIAGVLQATGAIARDPTEGNPNHLYYARVFEELRAFHPGEETESVRDVKLPVLTEEQWNQLTEVGTARVPSLVFARGTDRLTEHSQSILDELAGQLATTRFYVMIRGNAAQLGDLAQNKALAERRAQAAEQYLLGKGIDPHRIRALGTEPSGTPSVTFVLGQLPY
jgi:hypothetical protein